MRCECDRAGLSENTPCPVCNDSLVVPVIEKFNESELAILVQWFNSLQDVNEQYLDIFDYALSEKIYRLLGIRVPKKIKEKAHGQ